MEDGTIITTDKNGRYSVPALTPGRHLFRLDERTLPDGTYLTTDKVVVVDVTPGLLVKANFGINFHDGDYSTEDDRFFAETVKITLETGKPKPRLHVSLFGNEIAVANSIFVEKAEFRIFTNYAPFVEKWKLEILETDTRKLVQVFEGNRLDIHDMVLWDGRNVDHEYILVDRKYEYRVYLEDKEGKFDETKSRAIHFRVIEDDIALAKYVADMKIKRDDYEKWLREERAKDSLAVQTILVDGETVRIDRLRSKLQSIRVMKGGQLIAEIPIGRRQEMSAGDLLEQTGPVKLDQLEPLEIILPVGDYEILVQDAIIVGEEGYMDATQTPTVFTGDIPTGVGKPMKTYSKPIKVGDDQFFFVAMGDGRIGYTFTSGNIEPVQSVDKFQGGYWSEGKIAYYLQGKILGKYLIESSFDTERKRKEIFRNLDKDDYYPIYGDDSKIDYKATNTQGNLYALIEWDKSSVTWGNYSVGFEDTEFGRFSRSLYGGKVNFETLGTTKYGDPRSKIVAFRARAQQKSAHNEFLATGGSLYFLKHKDIIQGSDKIKIEVRDKITGLVLSERTLVESADYEMDYNSGRVVFWRPVKSIVEAYSIISNELLDGNLVYVVADYEYDVKDKFDEDNTGARVKQAIGEHVVIGGTYVRENLETSDYQLKGTDVTVKLGEKDSGTFATFVAEYAESESQQQPNFISTDGGLSFNELRTADSAQGRAFGLKGNAVLFNRLAISSYYKWVENDFSTSATTAQQGKEIIGFEAIYDITDSTRLTLRHDIQELIDDGNLQTQIQVGSNKTTVTMAQIVHEARRLKVTGEYQRRTDEAADTETDTVAVRADYTLSDRIKLSLEQQYSITGEDADYKTTIGVEAKPTDKITLRAQETIGEDGSSTTIGATVDVHEKLALTGDYSFIRPKDGEPTSASTIGAIAKINDRVKLHTTLGISKEGLTRSTSWELGGSKEIDLIGGTKAGADTSIDSSGKRTTVLTVGGTFDVTEDTSLDSNLTVTDSAGARSTTATLGGKKQLDENTEVDSIISVTDSVGARSTTVTFGGKKKLGEGSQVDSIISVTDNSGVRSTTVTVGGTKQLTEFTAVESKISVTGAQDASVTTISIGGKSKMDEGTEMDTQLSMTDGIGFSSTTFSIGGKKQVDEDTTVENRLAFTESTTGIDTTSLTFGSKKKLTDDIELVTSRSFSRTDDGQSSDSSYSLSKVKDGKKLKGTFTRKYAEGDSEVSQSNIFGLTGEIDDRWAATGSYERATVKNLDGTETQRDSLALLGGYVRKNSETGIEELKSSTKIEVRFDEGQEDKRQYLISSSTEGQLTQGLSVYGKVEMSATRNTSLGFTEASHKELIIGGAYRPIMRDDLNLLARYTYLEEKSPAGQVDFADIEEERSHVIAAEGIYDLTERWQITEKFAYRISEEKVAGFDFTKTHTWLMIHRLNYKITKDWAVGGEFRMLTQREAKDRKRGILVEATRRLGEYAQLGVGYDFTDFSDDLTNLDYTTQGPFLRITGKLYDRTPEEIERARQQWIDEKVLRWSWMMVTEELSRDDSPILEELNDYFSMAEAAYQSGDFKESKRIYKDIIIASQMMFDEAAEYIRAQIAREEQLKEMQDLADQYYKNGQYEKAKKILQKILDEAKQDVLKSSKLGN